MGKRWGILGFLVLLAAAMSDTAFGQDIRVLRDTAFKKGFRVNPLFCGASAAIRSGCSSATASHTNGRW